MKILRPHAHAAWIERLWRAAERGRLPHALLFEGRRGTGRFLAARWLASGLLCASGPGAPCGTCGPCKRVATGGTQGNHPDLFVLDPLEDEEERIKIARIARRGGEDEGASVEEFLDLVPMEGERRIVLIRECHRMNAAAQNALLKTLEEPRRGTVLVLETHRPGELLPTLLSRCVRVRFEPLSPEDTASILAEEGVPEEEARTLSRIARGSPGVALELRARGAVALLELVEEALAGGRHAHALAREAWELEGEFPGATASARARERARTAIDLAVEVLADAIRAGEGVSTDELAHGPRVARLAGGERLGPRPARRRLDGLLAARADVERNVQPEALVERLFLVLEVGDPVLSAALV